MNQMKMQQTQFSQSPVSIRDRITKETFKQGAPRQSKWALSKLVDQSELP